MKIRPRSQNPTLTASSFHLNRMEKEYCHADPDSKAEVQCGILSLTIASSCHICERT